nr:disease resistance protein RPM1-like [Ipomoea batatas]
MTRVNPVPKKNEFPLDYKHLVETPCQILGAKEVAVFSILNRSQKSDAWALFCRKAFCNEHNWHICPEELRGIGSYLWFEKCEGLRSLQLFALKVVSMGSKDSVRNEIFSRMGSMGRNWQTNENRGWPEGKPGRRTKSTLLVLCMPVMECFAMGRDMKKMSELELLSKELPKSVGAQGIEYLTRLEELDLKGVSGEFIQRIGGDGIDRPKIRHIPSIKYRTETESCHL